MVCQPRVFWNITSGGQGDGEQAEGKQPGCDELLTIMVFFSISGVQQKNEESFPARERIEAAEVSMVQC